MQNQRDSPGVLRPARRLDFDVLQLEEYLVLHAVAPDSEMFTGFLLKLDHARGCGFKKPLQIGLQKFAVLGSPFIRDVAAVFQWREVPRFYLYYTTADES